LRQETFKGNSDRLQLIPAFQQRDGQVEAIAQLILTEFPTKSRWNNKLYVDSLANILAVNMLRQFATTQPQLSACTEGGLPQRQLMQVLDYIDAHLDQEIKLANLAEPARHEPVSFQPPLQAVYWHFALTNICCNSGWNGLSNY
jgi:AraC family transcriptional regulator